MSKKRLLLDFKHEDGHIYFYEDGTFWYSYWAENHYSSWELRNGVLFYKHESDDIFSELVNESIESKFFECLSEIANKELLDEG